MADTLYTIRQGETGIFEISVLDENGQAIDISGSDTTNVIVTLTNKGTTFARYSLVNMGTDYSDLTVATNVISLLSTREETKLWDTGITKATVTIEQDDVTLTHSVYDFSIDNFLTIESSDNASIVLVHS